MYNKSVTKNRNLPQAKETPSFDKFSLGVRLFTHPGKFQFLIVEFP